MKTSTCGALAFLVVAVLSCTPASARELPGAGWKFDGDNNERLAYALDRKLETTWTSQSDQRAGVGFTIDFGCPLMLHRLLIKTGEKQLHYPRSLRLAAGEEHGDLKTFYDSENALVDPSLRFNPVKGRYLRMEIGAEGAGFPWSIAEIHLFGFDDPAAMAAEDAVILPDGMPDYVNQSARDVAYYAGEISDRPVAIAKPAEAADYPGTIFVVDIPAPVEYEPADFIRRNREAVHVYRKGREIHFAGETHQAVMYGMFEFLDRQGVRWLFPSADGDHIQRRGALDLSALPIRYAPQFVVRMFQGHQQIGRPGSEADRWFAHTHWNKFWNGGHAYREIGHHNFKYLIPEYLYKEHPDWFPMFVDERWEPILKKKGYRLGQRVPYGAIGATASFCTTSPGAREYIVQEAVARFRKQPDLHSFRVGQDDANNWCECPRCRAQDNASARVRKWDRLVASKTERLCDLVVYLDRRFKELMPERPIQVATFAYSEAMAPPETIDRLPDSVSVDLVQSSIRTYLPPSSPHNTEVREFLKGWSRKTRHLGSYNWDLLCTQAKVPVASITSLAEWFRFWQSLDIETVEPEANSRMENWRANPWLYYAYGRLIWHPDEPAEQVLDDFFRGYYRESAGPMLAYYKTLEEHIRGNDLTYGATWQVEATPEVFTPPILKKMCAYLDAAQQQAGHYLTESRVREARAGFDRVLKALDVSPDKLK